MLTYLMMNNYTWKIVRQLMSRRELLNEIDETLDQLIKNAAALKDVANDPLYETEVEALHKTQTSLLAHLLHLDRFLKEKSPNKKAKNLEEKFSLFRDLSLSSSRKKKKVLQEL